MDDAQRADFRDYVASASARLLRTAYLLCGDRHDAEDLLQTALARTYLAWPRIRSREAVDGYVRRVMVNTRTSWWRRNRTQAGTPTSPSPVSEASDDYARHDLQDALWGALARLTARQRAAVVLRYYEDLTEPETAAVLGVSVGTVKSTVSRALTRLRDDAGLSDDERPALPVDVDREVRR